MFAGIFFSDILSVFIYVLKTVTLEGARTTEVWYDCPLFSFIPCRMYFLQTKQHETVRNRK
jgi:hypothetical protein